MKLLSLVLALLLAPFLTMGQDKKEELPAYRLTNAEGEGIFFDEMVERASEADLVFFGEAHDDPIGHWLQLRLTRALYGREGDSLELGAEMFEAPDQLILNEYLDGNARMKDLKRTAKLWDNFETDYKPLLTYARKKGIPFLASNVPRRYAALVHRKGLSALDSLPEEAYRYMAENVEMDTGLASYQRIMNMGHGSNGKRIAKAQALKDATMAERIRERYDKGETFLHFNGTFHSDAHEGIVHYLREKLEEEVDVLVISTVQVKDLSDPKGVNWERKGDLNLLVPEDMTSTH